MPDDTRLFPQKTAWGPEHLYDGQVRFRLWAPDCDRVTLRLDAKTIAMTPEPSGWFTCQTDAIQGTPYLFELPDGQLVPDPAARQSKGTVHGASLVPAPVPQSPDWCRRPWEEAVIVEIHIGTFTEDGTFLAAIDRLDALAEAGYTAVEIMPVAQFGGTRGWGYDGVLPYAPHPSYGTPDDLRELVSAIHDRNMMAVLDVVYNHFGPDGNYLHSYASQFFDDARSTPWGAGIDYRKRPVRRFFIDNAIYWLERFSFDGLRLDAIDQIRDPSQPDLLVELATEVRKTLPDCPAHLTTEDNRNIVSLHPRVDGKPSLYTAEWNDDLHNAAHVLATGEHEGYYGSFVDNPAALMARALAEGFAFQGPERGKPSTHLPPAAFIDFLQNHDQTGNRAMGERLITLTDPKTLQALQAIHLLSPHIPLMFMGEDWNERRPFCFFADFSGDLGRAVTEGRRSEFAGFSAFAGKREDIPDPIAVETFEASKIDWTARDSPAGRAALARVQNLLTLRRTNVIPRLSVTTGHFGRVIAAGDGLIAVDWDLAGATLSLRANFTDNVMELPAAKGTLLHLTGECVGAAQSAAHFWDDAG